MKIGIGNIEKMVFEDQSAWLNMPEMAGYRDQWAFSKMSPHLKPTGVRAMMDFIAASDQRHEAVLSDHFGEEVTIDKFDPSPVKNIEFDLDEPPDLSLMSDYTGSSSHREGDRIKITLWR